MIYDLTKSYYGNYTDGSFAGETLFNDKGETAHEFYGHAIKCAETDVVMSPTGAMWNQNFTQEIKSTL